MAKWDENPNGTIALQPLVGWQAATFPMTAVVRLNFVRSEEQLQRGESEAIQLAMTAAQCREVGELLLRKAQEVEQQPQGTRQ